MFEKTKAIVLHQLKYDDKQRIVTVYSEKHGRAAFLISNTKKLNINIFRAFNILELNLKTRSNSKLFRVSEVNVLLNYKTIPYDIKKSSIAIFLSEIMYKLLKEENENYELFNFIINSASILDKLDTNISDFHLIFLISLTKYFGFYPYYEKSKEKKFFDLINGIFTNTTPNHNDYLSNNNTNNLKKLLKSEYNQTLNISRKEKNDLLNDVLMYIRIHIETTFEIKSHEILKEVFN